MGGVVEELPEVSADDVVAELGEFLCGVASRLEEVFVGDEFVEAATREGGEHGVVVFVADVERRDVFAAGLCVGGEERFDECFVGDVGEFGVDGPVVGGAVDVLAEDESAVFAVAVDVFAGGEAVFAGVVDVVAGEIALEFGVVPGESGCEADTPFEECFDLEFGGGACGWCEAGEWVEVECGGDDVVAGARAVGDFFDDGRSDLAAE